MSSLFDKTKDAVSNLIHHHEDPDADATLPPSASIVQAERAADDDLAKKALGGHGVKHEVLEKIRHLRRDDVKHCLGEVQELFDDPKDNTIQFFHPLRYTVLQLPHGVTYLAKVQLDQEGHCVHIRVFSPEIGQGPFSLHSIDTRPTKDGGAVFTKTDALSYFEY